MIDEVVNAALIGTRGAPARLLSMPEELSAVLPPQPSDPESQLLDAVACVTLFSLAGHQSHRSIAPPETCAADRWKECSASAAVILTHALEAQFQPLLTEWLELASRARRRPPHILLPKLLDASAAITALQPLVSAVIDERGRWLTQFNASWQFTSQTFQPADDIWQTGSTPQRAELLRSIRQADPAKALELIGTTWQDDGADDRTLWVSCLLPNLSDTDEDFLESCLDDRSSRVREVAADLLARLVHSKFTARMIDRLRPLISFSPGTTGQLLKLKRATKASLDVRLPDAFDKSMQRDGMTEKPKETLGPKQWLLQQIISNVPLTFWTNEFGVPPVALVESLPNEFATVFIRGWLAALSHSPVPEWIEPLITASKSEIQIDDSVWRAVPTQQRAHVLQAMLKTSSAQSLDLPKLLDAWRPLDEHVSQVLLDKIDQRLILYHDVYYWLHPRTLQTFETSLARQDNSENRRKLDQALTVLSWRRELHKELST
jgi:hypothetical protein